MQAVATMTGAAFDALPGEDLRLELLEGECVEMSSTTPEHQEIVTNLLLSLVPHLRSSGEGHVYPDIEFALGENTRLRPDLAIILGENWRKLDRKRIPVQVLPSIVVEVISPSERTAYSNKKVRLYLQRRVQEVWQIFPEDRTVLVYSPEGALKIFRDEDELTSSLVPGWSMPVTQMFEE